MQRRHKLNVEWASVTVYHSATNETEPDVEARLNLEVVGEKKGSDVSRSSLSTARSTRGSQTACTTLPARIIESVPKKTRIWSR